MLTPWPHLVGCGRAGQPGNRKQNDRQRSLPEHLRERGVAVIRPIGQNSSWVRGRWEESVEDREGGGGAFQEAGRSRGWGWSKRGGVSRRVMQSSLGGVTGIRQQEPTANLSSDPPLQASQWCIPTARVVIMDTSRLSSLGCLIWTVFIVTIKEIKHDSNKKGQRFSETYYQYTFHSCTISYWNCNNTIVLEAKWLPLFTETIYKYMLQSSLTHYSKCYYVNVDDCGCKENKIWMRYKHKLFSFINWNI